MAQERHALSDDVFVEIVVWLVPAPVRGSTHRFKYRLVLVAHGQCELRYDNEAGKGDHRHVGQRETPYAFQDYETLLEDFWKDVDSWISKHLEP